MSGKPFSRRTLMEMLIDKNPSEVEIHIGRKQLEAFVPDFEGALSPHNPVVRVLGGFRCCLVDADDLLKIEPIHTFKQQR